MKKAFFTMLMSAAAVVSGCGPREEKETTAPESVEEQASPLGNTPGNWNEVGPQGVSNGQANTIPADVAGAVHRIVVNPQNSNEMYIGTVNGGVWRTTNGTAGSPTWTSLSEASLPSLSISALAMDSLNSSRVAAATFARSSFFVGGPAGYVYLWDNQAGSWTVRNGLFGNALTGITLRGNTLLASSAFGFNAANNTFTVGFIFHSGNSGQSFNPPVLTTTNLFDLAADPSNTARYYAVGTGGVFRGINSGTTWAPVGTTNAALQQALANADNARIAVASTGRLYVVASNAGQMGFIATSNDQGTTWTPMDLPLYPQATAVGVAIPAAAITNAADLQAGGPIVITLAANHNLLNFNTTGNAFRARIQGVQGNTAANGDWIIRAVPNVNPAPANQFVLINRITLANSVSNGAYTANTGTWQPYVGLNTMGQGGVHLSIAADPNNSNLVYLGGDAGAVFIGTGCGVARGDATVAATGAIPSAQWAHIVGSNMVAQIPNGGTPNVTAPHADTRHLTFNSAGDLLIGTDGGVFLRNSPQTNTGDWIARNGNLGDLEIHDIAFDQEGGGVFFGGTQDNGTVMQDFPNQAKWNTAHTADGGDVAVAIDNTVPGQSIRYMSQQNLGAFQRATFVNNVLQSVVPIVPMVTGPAFPINIYQIEGTLPFVTRFAVNRNNGQRIVIGGTTTVYESFNRGDNVTQLGAAPSAVELDYGHPNNEEALWVAVPQFSNPPNVNADIYHRITGNLTLTRANPTFPGTVDPGGAQDVVMSATSERTAYAISGNRVYRDVVAANGTSTWTDITGDLQQQNPGFLRQVKFVASAVQDRLIVAGDQGVFMGTLNPPGFWSRVGTNLPRVVSFDLDYSQASDQLAVGTMGRGAWTFANISTNNLPPAVICQNRLLVANASCQGVLNPPGINNGSFDPEGQSLACFQTPVGPYVLGPTTLTLSCTDPPGSSNQCTATVTVVDQTKPAITAPPDITITTCVNPNLGTPTVADNCGTPNVTNNAPAKFPLGTTIVTWTATDGSGNFQTVTQNVTAILGDDSSCCPNGTNIIMGTAVSNNIVGTAGSDCILGLGGDDVIDAREGDDFVSGGAGNDTITGGLGHDFVFGGAGNDTLQTGTGDDFITGGAGTDTCSGGTGINTIIECESTSFCTAACCSTTTCVVPTPPGPDSCRPAFSQASCLNYGEGTVVSSGGDNWRCVNANCANCATFASCFPGAAGCPWGTVWSDLGGCH